MNIERPIKVCIIFSLGFLSANFISFYLVYGLESPFSLNFLSNFNNYNKTPSNFVKEEQIQVYHDKIIINIKDASISSYAPTGSMRPVLDENSNGIRIKPKSEQDVHIGDIITFKQNNNLIIHRVVDKGIDSKGIYFITKGDNNSIVDGKIRFEDIEYITVGVIW